MFYALFDIRSYRQLEKVAPELLQELIAGIQAEMTGVGTLAATPAPGNFLYSFSSRRSADIERMAAAVFAAHQRLSAAEAELMGFAVLLDIDQTPDVTTVYRAFRNRLLETMKSECLLVGAAGQHSLEHIFVLEPVSSQVAAVIQTTGKSECAAGYPEFSTDPVLLDSLASSLASFFSPAYQPRVIWIPTPRPIEQLNTIRQAAADLLRSSYPDCCCIVRLSDASPFAELLELSPQNPAPTALLDNREPGITPLHVGHAQRFPNCFAEIPRNSALLATLRRLELYLQNAEYCGQPLITALIADPQGRSCGLLEAIVRLLLHHGSGIPVIVGGNHEDMEILKHDWMVSAFPPETIPRTPLPLRYWNATFPGGLAELVSGFDTKTHIALHAIQLVNGSISYSMMQDLLNKLEIPPVVFPEICRTLAGSGLILSETILEPTIPDLSDIHPHPLSPDQRRDISTATAWFLQAAVADGQLAITPQLLAAARNMGDPAMVLDWFIRLSRQLLWSRRLQTARELLCGTNPLMGVAFSREASRRIRSILWVYRVQLALLREDMPEVQRLLDTGAGNLDEKEMPAADRGRILLERARVLQAHSSWDATLKYAKGAILAFQDAHDRWGMAEANTLIAEARLVQGSLPEAIDYLQIALELGSGLPPSLLQLHTVCLQAAALFLHGNYSRSELLATRVAGDAVRSNWHNHELWMLFLLARIRFELGDYPAARSRFEQGRAAARAMEHGSALQMFTLWSARCLSYLTHPQHAAALFQHYEQTPECLLFYGEALLLDGRCRQAREILQQADYEWEASRRTLDLQLPDFSNGFSLAEDIGIGRDNQKPTAAVLLTRVYSAAALLGCGKAEDAVDTLRGLVRSHTITPYDPHAAIYALLYAQALQRETDPIEDPNAVIGRAAKQLQERSTRMDNPKHKIGFLRHNRWSRELLQAAQASKMV
ncbi:hypothetical protein [Spirochaeta africana]|uniref:MalT-like TPR region domain-containing protein n=1 Tax=Spirochaeta africana (strain ATCC 700263 / DSM 8902 / Z-7692) TaxID=889378 RepID=H9UKM1_SPIAZ|nr:hypothetical protein [Spirochaeta africana]AFG38064.1 hypothetical protein Spiaf_2014 [Spirochaeta africana DSM 8902]